MHVIILVDNRPYIGDGVTKNDAMYGAILLMIADGKIDTIDDFVEIKDGCEIYELGKRLQVDIKIPEPIITVY